jgi:hypothetical protein
LKRARERAIKAPHRRGRFRESCFAVPLPPPIDVLPQNDEEREQQHRRLDAGHTVEGAKTLDQVKLIGLAPCFYLRIKRFRGIREIFKESRTQPAFHVEIRRIIPVSAAFLASSVEAVLMPRKRQVAGFFTLNSEIEVV